MTSAELTAGRRSIAREEVLDWIAERGVYAGLLLLIAFNLVFTPRFAEIDNIRLQFVQVVPVAIIALGMALVIGTRGIDLSVGSVMAIASALLALYLGYGPVVAITIALIGGASVGVVNGVLISRFGIQPIVATLALLVGGRGLALVIAQGRLTEIFDPALSSIGSGRLLGVPYVVLIALGVALVVGVLVARTTFGRYVVAIGGNPEASGLAGVPVRRTLLSVYVLSAGLAALAGIIQTARLSASDPSFVGNLIELSAITAVVVGGTPLSGGRVRIVGTLAGAMLMQLISATLITHNLPDSATRMVQAAIILAAVFIQRQRSGAVTAATGSPAASNRCTPRPRAPSMTPRAIATRRERIAAHAPAQRRVPDPRGGHRHRVARVRDAVRERGQLPEHPRGQLVPRPDRRRHDVRHHRRRDRPLGRLPAGAVRGPGGVRLAVRAASSPWPCRWSCAA